MKKILILLSIIAIFGMFVACGGDEGNIPGPEVASGECNFIDQEIILQSAHTTEPPDWVFGNREWRGTEADGEPAMFFFAEADSTQKNMASRSARGNVGAAAAESITKNVLSQFAE